MEPTAAQYHGFMLVARHGSSAAAARVHHCDASTLSRYVTAVTDCVGTPLMKKDGSGPTRAGRSLCAVLEQNEERLTAVTARLRSEHRPALGIIASEVVTTQFLPDILHRLQQRHPQVRCSTESGAEEQIQKLLRSGDLNLAIAPQHDDWRGFSYSKLIDLELVVLVPTGSPYRSAGDLWARGRITAPVFSSAASDTITDAFRSGLRGLRVACNDFQRVSSALAIRETVARGHGLGLTVNVHPLVHHRGVRAIPLPQFPRVPLGAYWRGEAIFAHKWILELLQQAAHEVRVGSGKPFGGEPAGNILTPRTRRTQSHPSSRTRN